MNSEPVSIGVVGSVNLDLVARVDRFPLPGETVTGATIDRHPGGKGANQALAARRLGARVYLLACLGTDDLAEEALAGLKSEGVNLDYCSYLEAHSTGLALIWVSADGENKIVVAPGANAEFHAEHLRMPQVDAVVAQLEVPQDTIIAAAERNQRFLTLNAAPARPVASELLDRADLLVVNELEAKALGSALQHYRGLLATTFGSAGAVLSRNGREVARAQAPKVTAVDTTGAGDTFTAALTVGLVEGMDPEAALQRACLAAAISVTRAGAQGSPTRQELAEFGKPEG
jgi:ribokinase